MPVIHKLTKLSIVPLMLGLIAQSVRAIEFEQVTDLSNWQQIISEGASIAPEGDRARFAADASSANQNAGFGIMRSPRAADGIMVTFNIAKATTGAGGFASMNLQKDVGKLGANFVRAEMFVALDYDRATNKNVRWIFFQICERTPRGQSERRLYQASFKAFEDPPEWDFHQDVTVAIARFGNEIWFFLNGSPTIAKYLWIGPQPLDRIDSQVEISSNVSDGSGFQSSITATVSNVILLFDGNQSTESSTKS